jgi:hypothetical protein
MGKRVTGMIGKRVGDYRGAWRKESAQMVEEIDVS